MPKWFYAMLCLLFKSLSARRDARVRFLQAERTILRRKLGGNRVVSSRIGSIWLNPMATAHESIWMRISHPPAGQVI